MKNMIKITAIIGFCIGAAGCSHSPLKAPCGPSAGLTDPCGNRIPINGAKLAKAGVKTHADYFDFKSL